MGKKIINYIIKIFWIFVIGSVFGFFAEMLYALVYTRTIEIRQGLIYRTVYSNLWHRGSCLLPINF